MNCSPPGSFVQRILQARILKWVAIPSLLGILLTQGPNPCLLCLLYWQVGSLRLAQPGKPPNILYMCKWYKQILLPACYFAKLSLNPYVGREGISDADTQHHQLQSREGFAGGKSQWGRGRGLEQEWEDPDFCRSSHWTPEMEFFLSTALTRCCWNCHPQLHGAVLTSKEWKVMAFN